MRAFLLIAVILAAPVTATAQANQTSRTFEDSVGRRVTCTTGQIGQRQTRGVAIVGGSTSMIDAQPTDALWRSSGCAAELALTPQQRIDRANAALAARFGGPRPGEPDTRFEDAMERLRAAKAGEPASQTEVYNPGRSGDAPDDSR